VSSRHYLAWCIEKRIDAIHIQPGKPTQNAYVGSFHGRLRDECLNVSWFWNMLDARKKIAAWGVEYNQDRPHSALQYQTPEEFAATLASPSQHQVSRLRICVRDGELAQAGRLSYGCASNLRLDLDHDCLSPAT